MTFNGITLLIIFLLSIFNFAVADESLPKNILDTNFQIEKINNSFFLINGSEKRPLKKCKPEQNFENGKSYGDFLFLEFSTVVQKYMMIYSTKTDWNVCYRVDASYFTDTKVLFFNLEKSTIEFAVIDGKNANFPVDYFSFFANDNIKSSRAKLQVNQTLKILELHLNGQVYTFNLSIFDQNSGCSTNNFPIWLLISIICFLLASFVVIILMAHLRWKKMLNKHDPASITPNDQNPLMAKTKNVRTTASPVAAEMRKSDIHTCGSQQSMEFHENKNCIVRFHTERKSFPW